MKLIGRTSRDSAMLPLSISADPSLCYVRQKKNKKRLSEIKSFSLDEPLQGDVGIKSERATLFRSKTYDVPLPQKPSDHESLDRYRSSSSNLPKHNLAFHKIFRELSENEDLKDSFTCALQKEVLYQGRLYISQNYLGFYCNMLRKEIKVLISVSSIIIVKKANTALLVPNALSVRTTEGEKYLFGSLRNREICYQAVRAVCPNLQDGSACNTPLLNSGEQNTEQCNKSLNSSHSDLEQIQHESDSTENCVYEAAPLLAQKKPSVFDEVDSKTQNLFVKADLCRDQMTSDTQWPDPRAMNVLLVIYMLLVLLLLFSSGYIGLRIMELENQLSIMGAWPKGEEIHGSQDT
ncbi:GRAM domain-containing protein 2A-like [Gastrophryne carolinensis]